MFEAPPEGLSYTPTNAGHAWVLPARSNLGRLRLFGFVPIAACLIFPAIAWLFVGGFLRSMGLPAGVMPWGPMAGGGLVALLIFYAERKVWWLGVALLCGRSEVRLEGGQVIAIERTPIGSMKRRIPVASVLKIEITGGQATSSSKPESKGWLADLYGITLRVHDRHGKKDGPIPSGVKGEKTPLAIGYPLALLEPLATDLLEHVNRGTTHEVGYELVHGSVQEIRARMEAKLSVEDEEHSGLPASQPGDSTAVVAQTNGELSIELPPAGLNKGSKGLFTMAVFWNGLVVLVAAGFVFSLFTEGNAPELGAILILLGVVAVFGGVGVWLMYTSISMGKRHTFIDVVGDTLMINTTTPFNTKQHSFQAGEIESINAGPSGTEINDVPVLELQIRYHPANFEPGGSDRVAKLGLLSSRSDEELRWLASTLRDRLGSNAAA